MDKDKRCDDAFSEFKTPPTSLVSYTESVVIPAGERQMTSAESSTDEDYDDEFDFTTPPASLVLDPEYADTPGIGGQMPGSISRNRQLGQQTAFEYGGSEPDKDEQNNNHALITQPTSIIILDPQPADMPSIEVQRPSRDGNLNLAPSSTDELRVPSDKDSQSQSDAGSCDFETPPGSPLPNADRDQGPCLVRRKETAAVASCQSSPVLPVTQRDQDQVGQQQDALRHGTGVLCSGSTESGGSISSHQDKECDEKEEKKQDHDDVISCATSPSLGSAGPRKDHKHDDKEEQERSVGISRTTVPSSSSSRPHKPELGSVRETGAVPHNAATATPAKGRNPDRGIRTDVDQDPSVKKLITLGDAGLLLRFPPDSKPDAALDVAIGTDVTSSGQSLSAPDRLPVTCAPDFASSDSDALPIACGSDFASSDSDTLQVAGGTDFVSSDTSVQSPSSRPHNVLGVINESSEISQPTSSVRDDSLQQVPPIPGQSGPGQQGLGCPGNDVRDSRDSIVPEEADRVREPRKTKRRKKKKPVNEPSTSSSNESSDSRGWRQKIKDRLNNPFKLKKDAPSSGSGSDSHCKGSSSSSDSNQSCRLDPKEHPSSSDSGNDPHGAHHCPFVNADTLRRSDLKHGVHVHSTLVLPEGAANYDDMSADEILRKLSSRHVKPNLHMALKRTLLTMTLPKAEKRQDLASVSLCLGSPDQLVRHRAGLSLERMLMGKINPRESSADMMLKVLKRVWCALEDSRHDQKDAISQYSHLLLLGTCIMLCRHDSPHQARSVQEDVEHSIHQKLMGFIKGSELNKSSVEFLLLKGVQEFFKDVPGAFTSRLTYHEADWEKCLQKPTGDWRREMDHKVKRANFAQLIQVIFSLCKEIMKRAKDPYVSSLTKEIKRTLKAVIKQSLSDQRSATFHFFLVRCLRLIINTSFKEDQQEIGEEEQCLSAGKVARLLMAVVKNAPVRHQEMLQDEIRNLSFHLSDQVRKEMKEFARDTPAMVELSLSYAEERLHIAGLRPQRAPPNEHAAGNPKQPGCAWHERHWRGEEDDRVLLQGAMCHPTQKCLASAAADDCVQHAEPQQRSRQHQKHLDLLIKFGDQNHFIRLLAFQISPRPCFYVTENVSKRLISLLIKARSTQRWLSSVVLLAAAKQIAQALTFLASKGIALRDVTAFNMVCLPNEGKHGEVKDVGVKLADLGLADDYLYISKANYENKNIRKQRDPGPIPVRWTSWEALFEGSFSDASMVFAFGFVLYELFTHGCWPYTEMGPKSIEDILQMFFRQSQCVRVFQWPCFPDDVYKLIRQCTEMKPADRPDIKNLEQKIQTLLDQAKGQPSGPDLGNILKGKQVKNESYPPISIEQRNRRYVPEKEIPQIIHQIMKGDPDSYKNLRQSSWSSTGVTAATDVELIAVDQCRIDCQVLTTVVQEQLTKEYVKHILPDVESSHLPGIVEWTASPTISATEGIHRRQYEPAVTLLQAAIHLGRGLQETRSLVHVLFQLATIVKDLHAQGWLYCDLRASYVLLTRENCKVILGRIGRMLKLSQGESAVRCPADRNKDSVRWCAPEVLFNNVVRKASDVFMLGTVFWEVFNARQKCSEDPTAESSPARLVPFPDLKSNAIPGMVQEGVVLPSLLFAKEVEWLNQLIYDCRNPDSDSRPTIDEVVERMEAYCTLPKESVSSMFRKSASLSTISNNGEPPVPPKRGFFKTFRNSFRQPFGIQIGTKNTRSPRSKAKPTKGKRKGNSKEEFYEVGYTESSVERTRATNPSSKSSAVNLPPPKPSSMPALVYDSEVYDEIRDSEEEGDKQLLARKLPHLSSMYLPPSPPLLSLPPPLPSPPPLSSPPPLPSPPPQPLLPPRPRPFPDKPPSQTKSSATPVSGQTTSASSQSQAPSQNDDNQSPSYADPENDPKISKTPPWKPPKDASGVPTFPSEIVVVNIPRAKIHRPQGGPTFKPLPVLPGDAGKAMITVNKERLPPMPPTDRALGPGQPESAKPKLKPTTRSLSQRLPMPLPGAAPLQTERKKPDISSYGDPVYPDPRKPLLLALPPRQRSAQAAQPSSTYLKWDGPVHNDQVYAPGEIYDHELYLGSHESHPQSDSVYETREIYEKSTFTEVQTHRADIDEIYEDPDDSTTDLSNPGKSYLGQYGSVTLGQSDPLDELYDDSFDQRLCTSAPVDAEEVYDDCTEAASALRGSNTVHPYLPHDEDEVYDDCDQTTAKNQPYLSYVQTTFRSTDRRLDRPRSENTASSLKDISSDEGYEPVGTDTPSGQRTTYSNQPTPARSSSAECVNVSSVYLDMQSDEEVPVTSSYQNVLPGTRTHTISSTMGRDALENTHYQNVQGSDEVPIDVSVTAQGAYENVLTDVSTDQEGSVTGGEAYENVMAGVNTDPVLNPAEADASGQSITNDYYLTPVFVKSNQK